jgi:signal transduction histidine kinase
VTSTDNGATRITIADNGVGISEAELPLVFDPYAATRSLDKSPSLGLAVCHRAVTALGGRVEVESSDAGTEVSIFLPPPVERAA